MFKLLLSLSFFSVFMQAAVVVEAMAAAACADVVDSNYCRCVLFVCGRTLHLRVQG